LVAALASPARRLAWLRAHPEAERDRFGEESDPGWEMEGRLLMERRRQGRMDEATLLRLIAVELERLTRIAEEAPALVGGGCWTEAALAACAQVARLYAELKRRHRAERARALLCAELRRFVAWGCPVERAKAPAFLTDGVSIVGLE
jgi:hypothetical protein